MARTTTPSDPVAARRFHWSVWTFVAPVALALCVLVIVSIARQAGWLGHAHTTKAAPARTRASAIGGGGVANTAILYRARKGDSLTDIAVRFGISIDRLHALNPTVPLGKALAASRRIRLR